VIFFAFLRTASYWNFPLLTSLVTMALVLILGLWFGVCLLLSPQLSPGLCFHWGILGVGRKNLGAVWENGKDTTVSPNWETGNMC